MDILWQIIEKEKITVKYRNLKSDKTSVYGLYVMDTSGPLIILDKYLENCRRLMKCILAEEIGHFYTVPRTNYFIAHTSYTMKIEMNQDERRALQYATDLLIPDRELTKALSEGYRSCYELAEYFDVTEWFMYRKMGFLKACFRRTGLKVRGRDLFECEMQPCNLI